MKLFLKIAAGIFALFIAVVVFVIATFDVNQYKDQIVNVVQKQTNRSFSIEGNLGLGVSLIPTIAVNGVKFGNSEWGSQPDMLTVGTFEAQVALLPLLSKNIEVKRLILSDATILLEKNKDGKGNWELTMAEAKPAEKKEAAAAPAGVPALDINEVKINKSTLTYIDAASGTTEKVAINELSVESGGFLSPMDLMLEANYNDIPIAVSGTSGSLSALTENKKFTLDIESEIGDISAIIKGELEKPQAFHGVDLSIELNVASVATINKLAKQELPEIGAVELTALIQQQKDTFMISDLSLISEITKVNGVVKISGVSDINALLAHLAEPLKVPGLELTLAAELSNTTALAPFTKQELPDTGPVKMDAKMSKQASAFFIDTLKATVNTAEFSAKGKITDVENMKGVNVVANLSVPKLSDLNKLSKSELPELGPLAFAVKATDKDGAYLFQDIKLTLANTDLTGQAFIKLGGERPFIDAALKSNLIDLAQLAPQKEEKPKAEEKKDKVFSADPLPFEALKTTDAKLDINAKKIKTADMDLTDVKLLLALNNGRLKLNPLSANTGAGSANVTLDLNASSGKSASLDTKVKVRDFEASSLPHLKGKLTGGKTKIDIDITGKGSSVAEIMAVSNGKIVMQMGEATLKGSDDKGKSTGLILMTFNNVFSGSVGKNKDTLISCGVINAQIKDGIATLDKGLAFNTNYMNIIGSGQVNLKTEEIKIGIDPQARKGSGISVGQLAELVTIKGTLANPKAAPDTKAALKTAASAGAALATGGLSILAQGLLDRKTSDADPCATAMGIKTAKKSEPKSSPKKQDEEKSVTEKATKSIKDTFKGLFD